MGALLLAAPLILLGSLCALATNSNNPRLWLPRGFEEADTYDWLQEHFGSDEITVLSWPGCTLDDPRVERLAEALVDREQPRFFERVVTGPRVLRELTSPPIGLPASQAVERLRGVLVGPDGLTTCLVLYISQLGAEDRPAAVEHVYQTARNTCGITRDQLRLGGPTVDAATIDVESQRMLLPLAGLSVIVAFLITWKQLGNLALAAIVLSGALYGAGLSLTILYIAGGQMNLVMTMLPPLVYVLSISGSVHLVNYYRDAVCESGIASASLRALKHGWRPCVLASATTAVGLLSLASSDITPVKMFGIYSAIGIVAGLVMTLLYLPAALTFLPASMQQPRRAGAAQGSCGLSVRFAESLCRRNSVVTGMSLLLMVGAGCGLLMLQSTVRLQYRFGADSRIIADYRWLETNVGPLVPLEVVVDFGPDCELDLFARMVVIDYLEQVLGEVEDVGATISAVDFLPRLPDGNTQQDAFVRAMLRRDLPHNRQPLYDAHLLADDGAGHQLGRITVRAAALSNVDFGRFTNELRDAVDPVLEEFPTIQATYTGMIPLIYKAQRELLNDLVESFLLAFAIIALVMMLLLKSVWAGLLAMLPNVFPVVVVFGLMGWSGIWIEIGTVMTASTALGIAVDDTLHYLTWFRRASRDGLQQHEAVGFAHRRCARAMVQTTLICACGLIVFSLSSFMPIVRFSGLMATLLLAALLGDLVFLPALLACRTGKAFLAKPAAPKVAAKLAARPRQRERLTA